MRGPAGCESVGVLWTYPWGAGRLLTPLGQSIEQGSRCPQPFRPQSNLGVLPTQDLCAEMLQTDPLTALPVLSFDPGSQQCHEDHQNQTANKPSQHGLR